MSASSSLTNAQLFEQYATAMRELRVRDVLRTNNQPSGDYAEWLAHRALGGVLAPPAEKSFDLTMDDGALVQVKARTVSPKVKPGQLQTSVFRSWDFDMAVFVQFAEADYRVVRAALVPKEQVRESAMWSEHQNGWRVIMRPQLLSAPGSKDLTASFIAATQLTHADIDHQQRLRAAALVEPAGPADQVGKFIVTTPDGDSAALSKRQAMLALVQGMRQEMSCRDIGDLLTPSTFVRVDGTLTGSDLWNAMSVQLDIADGKRAHWFVDEPIHEDGATWVLAANVWGPSTEARMAKLAQAGSGLITVRRTDEDQVA